MAVISNAHRAAKETRIAFELPQAHDAAVDALGFTREQLEQFERTLSGAVVLPGMPSYDEDKATDPVFTAHPLALIYCETVADVALCLREAHTHGWWITCRSGGHSTGGYSVNDGVVIDVSLMDAVWVDPHARRARVQSGANLGILDRAVAPYGLHVPGGTCADVGVAGHMMGGGFGFTSRCWGMDCDNVVEVTVMLADGRIVTADRKRNRDLFWAVRGGTGNNFGVLLDTTYELHSLPQVWAFALKWPADQAAAAYAALHAGFTRDGAARELGYMAVLAYLPGENDVSLSMLGMDTRGRKAGMAEIAPLLSVGTPQMTTDTLGSYLDLNEGLLNILRGPGSSTTYELKRSGYVAAPIGEDGWADFIAEFQKAPDQLNIALFEPYGGRIAEIGVEDCAFIHRDVDFDLYIDSFWEDPKDEAKARGWLDDIIGVLEPHLCGQNYQNYPERGMTDFRTRFWGESFGRLLAIKEKYDPGNFFHFEQSISAGPGDVPDRSWDALDEPITAHPAPLAHL